VAPYHTGSKTTPPTYPQPGEPTSFFTMEFTAYGHENISATHKTTIMFTKDDHVTVQGDCIVGIKADFEVPKENLGKIRITISVDDISEEIIADYCSIFSDEQDMVIRKSDYRDERTFAINADKAAADLDRGLTKALKKGKTVKITIKRL